MSDVATQTIPRIPVETEAPSNDSTLVVGEGARFEGLLTFGGTAIVEGELRGEIVGHGTLVLGEGADVEARIEVDELISSGSARGEIEARERVELRGSARLSGELRTPRLCAADGCIIDARCHMRKPTETGDLEPE